MAKRWNLVASPEYFRTLRRDVLDAERFMLVTEIWGKFSETDDPTNGAEPEQDRSGKYSILFGKYLLSFGIPVNYDPPENRENDIDLFVIHRL